MEQKALFIVNEKAGKAQIKNHIVTVVSAFQVAGYLVTVTVTQAQKDATRFARDIGGNFDLLLCSGGDGTLNEVINGLMQLEEKRPLLAYLPSGSTNDFAANLYTDLNITQNTRQILDGLRLPCDTARFNDRYFIYCAAFGAFALTSYETAQINKNIFGRLAYLFEGTRHLQTLKAYRFHVRCAACELEDDYVYGMVTNSDSVAGIRGFGGRNVQLDDGLYEVLLIKMPLNLLELQQIVSGLIKQDFSSPLFIRFKTDHITFESDEPIAWNLDGEFGGNKRLAEISVCHNAVTFLAPRQPPIQTA